MKSGVAAVQMDKREALRKAGLFADLVNRKYKPREIILFGSYAKNTYREESDIDIAVVLDRIEDNFLEKETDLYKIRRTIDENIEPVLLDASDDKTGFLEQIEKDGEIIYKRELEHVKY